jgi:hypothetical protein
MLLGFDGVSYNKSYLYVSTDYLSTAYVMMEERSVISRGSPCGKGWKFHSFPSITFVTESTVINLVVNSVNGSPEVKN